jgi:DNA adenine methylase
MRAARFIYLNRTCWNGLYRVNKKGEFNVPIGTKSSVILEGDDFELVSKALKSATITTCDFETTIDKAGRGDFIFIDPPYTVKHNLNGFIKYNENIFSWQDQVRLKKSISDAVEKGAFVLVTNANHKSIKELYKGSGEMIALNRASVIAGKSEARGTYSELAIKSW